MANGAMGDLTPENQETDNPFPPEVVEPVGKRLEERSKIAPKLNFFRLRNAIVGQFLAHKDATVMRNIMSFPVIEKVDPTKIIGGGKGIGLSGDACLFKLVIALIQLVEEQDNILKNANIDFYGVFKDEYSKEALGYSFQGTRTLVTSYSKLAKCYFAKKRLGGKEVEQVANMLAELSDMRYLKITPTEEGETVDLVHPIIVPRLPVLEGDRSKPFVVLLQSDLANNEGSWIGLSTDFLGVTRKWNVLQYRLLFLLSQLAAKRNVPKLIPCEINVTETNLFQAIASESKYHQRPTRREKDFTAALEECKRIGMIIDHRVSEKRSGEIIHTFIVEREYYSN